MKKVNFNVLLKDMKGGDMKDSTGKTLTVGNMLADIIMLYREPKSPVRMYTLGMAMYGAKDEIEVEDADWDELKIIIVKAKATVIVLGQIYKIMDAAEEKAKIALK